MSNDRPPFDDELRRALDRLQRPYTTWNLTDMWQRLGARRMAADPSPDESNRRSRTETPRNAGRPSFARMAQIGALAALASLAIVVGLRYAPTRHVPMREQTVYTTDNAQRARITLLDGTVVVLNVASRLDIPRDFGRGHRVVRVHGEASFHVVSAAGTPFIVDAGRVRAVVLGTEFGVRSYDTNDVRVAVKSGKVSMAAFAQTPLVLAARDQARLTPDGRLTMSHQADVGAALDFVTGHMTLGNVALRDAIVDLDRWYDVDIRLADPALGALPLSGRLTAGSASDLTDILQRLLDVRVVQQGRVLTLSPR